MAWSPSPQDTLHSLALKSDGTVVTWGLKGTGEYTVPGGLNGAVAIAANGYSLALKSDGTVVAWGTNYFNQAGPTAPCGLNDVVAIAAGSYHVLALVAAAPQPFTPARRNGCLTVLPLDAFGGSRPELYRARSDEPHALERFANRGLDGSTVQITDTNASAYPRRFYRVRTQ